MAKRIENGESKPTHEEIAHRARAIYEESGQLPGHDLDNWLQAETELQAARKGPANGTGRQENREPASANRSSAPRNLRETTSRS
jgi:hypothetical protein